jgi:hypothetical protein
VIRRHSDLVTYATTVVLMTVAFLIARSGLYSCDDPIAYWIGVVGGSLMLVLLLYPLRKYVRWLWVQRLGKMKAWLRIHMIIGILAPTLILLHCTFRTGSVNAAIALWSMIIVMFSGFIGRFLYSHTKNGLRSEQRRLETFKKLARLDDEVDSTLWFSPYGRRLLDMFEERALDAEHAALHWAKLLMFLPAESWMVRFQAQHSINEELEIIAKRLHWSYPEHSEHIATAKHIVVEYLTCIMRVALYRAWDKLFSYWHVAHVPFVFMLVFASITHIIAVHFY